jgi:alkyl hydroperoxide reductase subunit AhpC
VNAFPTVYILDADGVIRAKNVRGEGLGKKVDELLVELKARGTD